MTMLPWILVVGMLTLLLLIWLLFLGRYEKSSLGIMAAELKKMKHVLRNAGDLSEENSGLTPPPETAANDKDT